MTFAATSGAIQAAAATTDATGTVTATLSTGGDTSLRTITITGTSATLTSTLQVKVVAPSSPTIPVYSMGHGTGTGAAPNLDLAVNDPPGPSTLAAGGTTGLLLTIVDQTGNLYTGAAVTVTFSSPCIASGASQILPSGSSTPATTIITSTGAINATYAAKGCAGSDTIRASATVAGQNISANGTVTIGLATTGSIQFLSATPTTIGLKGTGLNETSTLIFKVTDSTGGGRPGVVVSFALDSSVGGLGLTPLTATSASDGTVQTVVSSGTVHTVTRVTASIASPALSTQSSQLSVTTGLPASGAFSIAVGAPTVGGGKDTLACPNVETWDIDGVQIPISVRLADRYNNPVPDGTAVAFYTNGGHIGGSCTTPAAVSGDGTCIVTWTSANPRPQTTDSPPVLADGRAQIIATAVGEESFTDQYGTGFYQTPDPFSHLGEPFLSANESAGYITGDYFLDYNGNRAWDPTSGSFVGISCSGGGTAPSSPPLTCSTSTLAISATHLMIMSTSRAVASLVAANSTNFTNSGTASSPQLAISLAGSKGSGTVVVNVQDENGNSAPAGTTIAFAFTNSAVGAVTQTPNPFVVGCSADLGGQNYQAAFTVTALGSGTLSVTITAPNGTITVLNMPVTVSA